MRRLPEASAVRGGQAAALHSLLPGRILQPVSVSASLYFKMTDSEAKCLQPGLLSIKVAEFDQCPPLCLSQGVSEEPLAQSQGPVSTQHGERGPAIPGQRARVAALVRPPHPAAGGLLQVGSRPGLEL